MIKSKNFIDGHGVMKKLKKCPKCKSQEVIPIIYGLPGLDLAEKESNGEVKLGGCLVIEGNPEWHCKNCGYEWK